MKARTYLVVSGSIFGIVSVFHLLRILNDWALVLGSWSAPMWVSWFGLIFPGLLCVWACKQARQSH